jgi:hypothetical protein
MSINFEFQNLDFVVLRDGTWAVFVKDPNTNEGILVCRDRGYLELADYDKNLCCDNGKTPSYDVMIVIRGCKAFGRAIDLVEGRGIYLTEEIIFDRRKHLNFKSLNNKHIIVFRGGTVGKPNPENEAFVTENHSLKYSYFDENTGQCSTNSSYDIVRIVEINSYYEIKTIFTGKER